MEGQKPEPGAWCHIEIAVDDTERAKKFYGECFGWKFTDVPQMGGYVLYESARGGIGGGIMKRPPEMPQQMVSYVLVDDVDAATERVKNQGGKVLKERTEVPQAGWFAVVSDPDGNAFGLWQGMGPQS